MKADAAVPVHRIAPARGWVPVRPRELWDYRELLQTLVWREVRVRYKQTVLGVAWAVLQPVLTMVVFSVFFGRLAGIETGGPPYPVFAYCALLPWQLFAYALTESSNSVVANQRLLTKVYFPRLLLPLMLPLRHRRRNLPRKSARARPGSARSWSSSPRLRCSG